MGGIRAGSAESRLPLRGSAIGSRSSAPSGLTTGMILSHSAFALTDTHTEVPTNFYNCPTNALAETHKHTHHTRVLMNDMQQNTNTHARTHACPHAHMHTRRHAHTKARTHAGKHIRRHYSCHFRQATSTHIGVDPHPSRSPACARLASHTCPAWLYAFPESTPFRG